MNSIYFQDEDVSIGGGGGGDISLSVEETKYFSFYFSD